MKSELQTHCLPQVIFFVVLSNHSVSGDEKFKGGTLIGTYPGIAKNKELITLEASGVSPEGRYVVLQKDNNEVPEEKWSLHVGDFAAFGEYTSEITGTYITQIK